MIAQASPSPSNAMSPQSRTAPSAPTSNPDSAHEVRTSENISRRMCAGPAALPRLYEEFSSFGTPNSETLAMVFSPAAVGQGSVTRTPLLLSVSPRSCKLPLTMDLARLRLLRELAHR